MRTDWMYLLEEAIVPLKKALIPVGHDLDENIYQRVQNHESIISLKSFMLFFITEYDQDLSVVIACFAEKLSSICLQWLILILSYGEGNAAISTVEEEDIKKEIVKEKSLKSILIVREDDGEGVKNGPDYGPCLYAKESIYDDRGRDEAHDQQGIN
jgi:hypothetical protein